ncbi:protein-disulfide reductase DsbD [Bermanella marisrubri]|uniref:Protein-disulfide reductase n=1 Tax=Bermanella marisrubri TaxID=207949 RepID=Q1MYE5_9GAMM|nr:protein-disulfide reductase DsbD [Bermanella marisrubri]EAT11000.1 Protein-disulfide reductase [Oceanobacter sp. RED65] [Bermanella marisrubri]QIZ83755.1 protein-disulfide reductase DsbD [Bermanella marisrubri]
MKRFLLLIMILISGLAINSHGTESEFLPVEQAFAYEYSIENNTISIQWDIEDGYYLYLERIQLKQGETPLNIRFQQTPKTKVDDYFGKTEVFHHQLNANASLTGAEPLKLRFQGCAEAGLCYPPVKVNMPVSNFHSSDSLAKNSATISASDAGSEMDQISQILSGNSLLWQILVFFALGIGLAFTPCVFPMIPILSSIIVGQGESITTRRAFFMSLTYVIAMASTYAIAGTAMGYFGAEANVQMYLQNPWVITSFAAVFVALSLSMFGLYEIVLPRFIQDRLTNVQNAQQGGSLVGVGIMGMLSALVVSPCVSAPLAGTLVYISTTGDALLGGLALLALGLGMGVPLLVIGTGGGRFMPKSGVWMNTVKSLFGIALLAIAIWLLGRVISAQFVLLLWGILLIATAVYFGALSKSTDNGSRTRQGIFLGLLIYGSTMVVGSAMGNSDVFQPLKMHLHADTASTKVESLIVKTDDVNKVNQVVNGNNGKWVVIDLYADWCASCKIMDKEIFKHPETQSLLQELAVVKLDITSNQEAHRQFLNEHGIYGPPAIVLYKDGLAQPKQNLIGEVSRQTFMVHMQTLL